MNISLLELENGNKIKIGIPELVIPCYLCNKMEARWVCEEPICMKDPEGIAINYSILGATFICTKCKDEWGKEDQKFFWLGMDEEKEINAERQDDNIS